MKIGNIEFPDRLLTALRNGNLVVFAGAGVSKAKPAKLPGFRKLAKKIAANTGQSLGRKEPPERFLGRLEHDGVKVQERAASFLSSKNPRPTDLHRNLLRLSKRPETVRIVTTNFDTLFEDSAEESLKWQLEVYQAPALPLGSDFRGLAHVHGAIGSPRTLVLTEADFGRAYLTQGWARRFLVDLFRSFTVVFVGYSHEDVIMNYLTRALPAEEIQPRFALTHEAGAEQWRVLGIEPIIFRKPSKGDYSVLYDGIRQLADYTQRSILDWKREVIALAEGEKPPIDEGALAVMEEALSDITKLQFFTGSASSPEWIGWLNEQGRLDNLFGTGKLSECDRELGFWLATSFAGNHSERLFLLIAKHPPLRLNPAFWNQLAKAVSLNKKQDVSSGDLSRWVAVLLATVPFEQPALVQHVLAWLAERCGEAGLSEEVVKIFGCMADTPLQFSQGSRWPRGGDKETRPSANSIPISSHHDLNTVWEKCLKPRLESVAESLLSSASNCLEAQYRTLSVWDEREQLIFQRQAIEPHEQNRFPEAIDVVIDAARDSLEWLAEHRPESAVRWCGQLVSMKPPLLRRLAVHGLAQRHDIQADEKVDWLLANFRLSDRAPHHELFQAMHSIYPKATTERRRQVVEDVLSFRWPETAPEGETGERERLTSLHHFNWLHWLHEAAPDCDLAKQSLDGVKRKYPDFEPREYPDLHWWIKGGTEGGWLKAEPPLSMPVDEMLKTPITEEWINEVVSSEPTRSLRSGWEGWPVALTVRDAAKKDARWSLQFAEGLHTWAKLGTALWGALFNAWEAEVNEGRLARILQFASGKELQEGCPREIAHFLRTWAENGQAPHPADLLGLANQIAMDLWPCVREEPSGVGAGSDWLIQAINAPAGYIAEYWVSSLSLWCQERQEPPGKMGEPYRGFASMIARDAKVGGRLARCIFSTQLRFLLAVDEEWTKTQLIPWFSAHEKEPDYLAVWDGFLSAPRISPQVAEHMSEPLLGAVEHICNHLAESQAAMLRSEKLIAAYALVLAYFADDPQKDWIPRLFEHASEVDSEYFAHTLQRYLRRISGDQKREWWNRWLRGYWENRLHGVPTPLKPKEVAAMLEWPTALGELFPEAVALATQMEKKELEYSAAIHYLIESDLWRRHPLASAEFLVCLDAYLPQYQWGDSNEMIQYLLQEKLPEQLERELRELVAKNIL